MKKFLFSVCCLSLPLLTSAQNPVPNPGMETWTQGNPNSWLTNNVVGTAIPVTQTGDAHGGSSAAKLQVLSALGNPFPGLLTCNAGGAGFPVSQSYGSLRYYYKATLLANDFFSATAVFYDAASGSTGGGSGTITAANNTNVYTQAIVPIFNTGGTPVTAALSLTISSLAGLATVGSFVQVDDILLSTSTGIGEETELISLELSSPYPNPASGISLLPFSLAEPGEVEINVFDLQGRLVQKVIQQPMNAGRYKAEVDARSMSACVYNCVLKAGDQQRNTRLIVKH